MNEWTGLLESNMKISTCDALRMHAEGYKFSINIYIKNKTSDQWCVQQERNSTQYLLTSEVSAGHTYVPPSKQILSLTWKVCVRQAQSTRKKLIPVLCQGILVARSGIIGVANIGESLMTGPSQTRWLFRQQCISGILERFYRMRYFTITDLHNFKNGRRNLKNYSTLTS